MRYEVLVLLIAAMIAGAAIGYSGGYKNGRVNGINMAVRVLDKPCECKPKHVCDAGDYLMARDENGVGRIIGTPQCCRVEMVAHGQ